MKVIEFRNNIATNGTLISLSPAVGETLSEVTDPPAKAKVLLFERGNTDSPSYTGVPAPAESNETAIRQETRQHLTIDDLGWSREKAAQIRAQLAHFAADWDDPAMDIYDEI